MDTPYEAPRGRLLSTLAFFLFVLTALFVLFLFFQQLSLKGAVRDLDARKVEVEAQMEELRAQEIEELFVAEQLRDRLEADTVLWSKVVRSLQDLTPVTVFLTSYSLSELGEVQVSGLGDSFGSVADAILSLEKSPDFLHVFVPSVTAGKTSDGQPVVSFTLQLDLLPQ
jgi:Tfp pilus assembly protein PilN